MCIQFTRQQLVSLVIVNVLLCLLVQTVSVSTKYMGIPGWPPISDVIYRFPSRSASSSAVDMSPELHRGYREWNQRRLRELVDCLRVGSCGPNQTSVVLVAARWFDDQAAERDWKGFGPLRQSVSEYKHLQQIGYTTLFSKNFEEALELYRILPDLVKLVIHDKSVECYANSKCVQGASNPTGIPAWKIFDFELFITHIQDISNF